MLYCVVCVVLYCHCNVLYCVVLCVMFCVVLCCIVLFFVLCRIILLCCYTHLLYASVSDCVTVSTACQNV